MGDSPSERKKFTFVNDSLPMLSISYVKCDKYVTHFILRGVIRYSYEGVKWFDSPYPYGGVKCVIFITVGYPKVYDSVTRKRVSTYTFGWDPHTYEQIHYPRVLYTHIYNIRNLLWYN